MITKQRASRPTRGARCFSSIPFLSPLVKERPARLRAGGPFPLSPTACASPSNRVKCFCHWFFKGRVECCPLTVIGHWPLAGETPQQATRNRPSPRTAWVGANPTYPAEAEPHGRKTVASRHPADRRCGGNPGNRVSVRRTPRRPAMRPAFPSCLRECCQAATPVPHRNRRDRHPRSPPPPDNGGNRRRTSRG